MPKQKKIHLKYGRMRLNYLKEHKKVEYTIMFMKNLTEDMKNTDMLYWVKTMNAINQQAEKIIL